MSLSGILQPIDGVPLPGHGVGAYNLYCKTLNGYPPPYGGGDVVGPNVAVNNNIASFNGTTGKLIQDSGVTITGAGSISGNNTGDVTLGAFGAAPNANGASLAGQVLTLQPASAAQPGGVTTGAQTLAGTKSFFQGVVLNVPDLTYPGDSNVLNVYERNITGTTQTWNGPWAAPQTPHAFRWECIGNLKTVTINGFQATPGGVDSLIVSTVPLPAYMWPSITRVFYIEVINDAAVARGTAVISTAGVITIGVGFLLDTSVNPPTFAAGNNFSAAAGGNHGLINWQFSWIV